MTTSDRLIDLLVHWEDERRQGRAISPEELCPDDSALRETLRQRIQQRERLGELWTSAGETRTEPSTQAATREPRLKGFEILGTLGAGGMGVVYQARQTGLDRPVALKMIRAGACATSQELSRFRREAEATARLQHPNIVQLHEIGESDGQPYLVLEFVGGGSLAKQLGGIPQPPQRAAELLLTLARAVQHAHEHGILHRDLKPANVLLTKDGTPKIADFGLARRLDADRGETATGAILGSPSYMAPEQAQAKVHDLSPATDVYALGGILYECLTGRPPFQGTTVLDTLEQVRGLDPVPPTTLQPKVPRDLEIICLKCLAKVPAQRYPSAQELAADLQRFLVGEPVQARSPTVVEQLTRALSFKGAPATMRPRSFAVLLLSPLPAVIQLTLFLLFWDQLAYPVICILVASVVIALIMPAFLLSSWALLRTAPRIYRRFVVSMISMRFAGYLLVPAIVALARPGHDLAEFYLVLPFWTLMDGTFYFIMGIYVGPGYPLAFLHYALALLITLILPFGFVIYGVMTSTGLVLLALYLRSLGE